MREGIKAPVWVALVLALALVGAACSSDTSTPGDTETTSAAPTGGTFSVQICEPESLIPQINAETCGSQVLKALFTPLVTFTPDNEPVMTVAESITSDDNIHWTVTLREGWTFHDGTPVTAQSFVDAWNWAAYAPNAAGNNYFMGPFGVNIVGYDALNPDAGQPETDAMSGLVVVDETTFTVELGAPFSEFPITVSYNAFYPLPESFFADDKAFNEAPVGNGPYMMDGSWEHDVTINVVRYDGYGGDTPGNADAIEFPIYADPDVAYRDVQAGNLDFTEVPPEQIESARTEFGDRYTEWESSSFSYIGFPIWLPEYQNPDVRRAMSMAIDRQAVIDAIFFSTLTPADDMASPVVQGYREDVCQYCVYDPDAAREMYEAAGGPSEITIWFNNDGGHEEWIEAVSNQWQQNLGVTDVTFESSPFAKYLGTLDLGLKPETQAEGITGPFRLGWVMDYPSMQNYLENLHGTGAGSNYTTFSNAEFDELLTTGKNAASLDEAVAAYQAADDIVLDEMPIIPLWFGLGQYVQSECISNVNVDKFTFLDVAAVQVSADC